MGNCANHIDKIWANMQGYKCPFITELTPSTCLNGVGVKLSFVLRKQGQICKT
uniref:Uncharacterized protein n=1 Tax=Arundo donax TaxID=35708 RepID=A0A0A9DUE4_ARUDO